jgi:hypothetical protein
MIARILRHLAYRRALARLEAHRKANYEARVDYRKRRNSAIYGILSKRVKL